MTQPRVMAQVSTEELAALYAQLDADRVVIVEAQDRIKAELRARLAPGKHPAGNLTVTVTPNRRFNSAQAITVLTPEQVAACCVTVVDRATAQQYLPSHVYELCQVEVGDARVTIR
jgi:hypothetical protein